MRDYAKLAPTFWTGTTGKNIRKRGANAIVVALYLMSAPGSNMLGLYYQPLSFMAHETGLGLQGASKGLQECQEAGFCAYDPESECVFVFEMAKWQIADSLKSTDNRCAGIQKDYNALQNNPFLGDFFDRYKDAFHLTNRRGYLSPLEAPPKPGTGTGTGTGEGAPSKAPSEKASRLKADWELPEDWANWAIAERPDLDPHKTADSFKDFWIAKAGKDGAKLDWQATWRNWVRNQRTGKPGMNGTGDIFGGGQ